MVLGSAPPPSVACSHSSFQLSARAGSPELPGGCEQGCTLHPAGRAITLLNNTTQQLLINSRVCHFACGPPQLVQLLLLGLQLRTQQADVLLLKLPSRLAGIGSQTPQRGEQRGALCFDLFQLSSLQESRRERRCSICDQAGGRGKAKEGNAVECGGMHLAHNLLGTATACWLLQPASDSPHAPPQSVRLR